MAYSFTANGFTGGHTETNQPSGQIFGSVDNPVAGNIIFGFIALTAGVTLNSITDSATNTYTIFGPSASKCGFQFWGFYCKTVTYSVTDYLTANYSADSTLGYTIYYGELQGNPATGFAGPNGSTTATAATSVSMDLTGVTAGSAIVAGILDTDGEHLITIGGAYSTSFNSNSGTYAYSNEYILSSPGGTVAVDASDLSLATDWNMIAMAFNPASVEGIKARVIRRMAA